MANPVTAAVRLIRAARQVSERKWTFLGMFALVFCTSVITLGTFDLLPSVPESPAAVAGAPVVALASDPVPAVHIEDPVQVEIPAIGTDVAVANPASTAVETLDEYLLKGAVRYPTSAKLGEDGNVVLFGHSSYLPVVGNQAYKTFNGIQKLVVGDTITVSSSGTVYTYAVRTVAKESAASNAGIPLAVSGKVLTLVTCNSFATKSDRFVVTADFVESHPIPTAS